MKRDRHITINITNEEFEQLQQLANKERRKLADFVALVVLDSTEKERVELLRIGEGDFRKVNPCDIIKS